MSIPNAFCVPGPSPQAVVAPLTHDAIFLVVAVKPDPESQAVVRGFCADLGALIRAVAFRDIEGNLSCVIGFGSDAWDTLVGAPARRGSTRSRRSAAPRTMPCQRRVTSCSISGPRGWTC